MVWKMFHLIENSNIQDEQQAKIVNHDAYEKLFVLLVEYRGVLLPSKKFNIN